jgi:uncharacterized membrane protein
MAEVSGKKEAQERVDRIHAFRRELEQLAGEGVLTFSDEQRVQLDGHLDKTLADLATRFDVDISDSQKQISLAMRIASALGGLALCAAVVMFFYRYWGVLRISVQVGILIAIPILLLLAMDFVSRKEQTLYYTSLLGIVAFASFILNLNMVGSIFNMAPSQNAFLAWGLFALVLGYSYRLRLQLAAGLVLLVSYLAIDFVVLHGSSLDAVFGRPETFLPGALALLATPLILRHSKYPGFPMVYRLFGLAFAFLALLFLSNWGQLSFLPFAKKTVEGIYQTLGFVVAVTAIWTGFRHRCAESINLGSGFFAIFLFNRLFVWWWDWMPKYLFFLIIGIIALILLAVFRRFRAAGARKATA